MWYWTADPSAANTTNFCNFNNNGNSNNNGAHNEGGVAPISSSRRAGRGARKDPPERTIGTYDRSYKLEFDA